MKEKAVDSHARTKSKFVAMWAVALLHPWLPRHVKLPCLLVSALCFEQRLERSTFSIDQTCPIWSDMTLR